MCDDIIDLTSVDTSDEEDASEVHVGPKRYHASGHGGTNSMMKIISFKRTRSSRLQIMRPVFAEKIFLSLLSDASKEHFAKLHSNSKRTYVGDSINPFLGNALFAAETIQPEEFIFLYIGKRMSWNEASARMDANQCGEYMIYARDGVVIDGRGVGMGAAMANHSCEPNAELQHDKLPGFDHAPICLLRATDRIEMGEEINTNYGLWDPVRDDMPDLNDKSAYIPCRCLKQNCSRVFKKLK